MVLREKRAWSCPQASLGVPWQTTGACRREGGGRGWVQASQPRPSIIERAWGREEMPCLARLPAKGARQRNRPETLPLSVFRVVSRFPARLFPAQRRHPRLPKCGKGMCTMPSGHCRHTRCVLGFSWCRACAIKAKALGALAAHGDEQRNLDQEGVALLFCVHSLLCGAPAQGTFAWPPPPRQPRPRCVWVGGCSRFRSDTFHLASPSASVGDFVPLAWAAAP